MQETGQRYCCLGLGYMQADNTSLECYMHLFMSADANKKTLNI